MHNTQQDQESEIDEDLADAMVEEFLEIMMNDIKENPDLIVGKPPSVDQFKDKFPFNLESDESEEEVKPIQLPQVNVVKVEPVVKPPPVKTEDDLARERYEAAVKKLQDNYQANVNYLETIIEGIDKEELIASL